jgi:spermidine synthase
MPVWAALCFLVSGAAGLLYEIVWSKQISYLLGSSLHSISVVVAAFLGGLALGARVLGGRLARSGDPGRRYAQLELAVAILGLAVLPALRLLDAPVGQLYRWLGGEGPAFIAARVVLAFAALVPPAALMGATLPVLVARCEQGALGPGLARLYALNTIGAVVGSLLAGFVLLPRFGLTVTTVVAAALNLVAGMVAWANSRSTAGAPAPVAANAGEPLLPAPARRVLGVAFAASGFAALALQIAWVRLYGLVLGSSVYSFSAVLGIYLAGIAIGSAVVAPFLRRLATPAAFAVAQLALAASAVAGVHAYGSLPGGMLALGERIGDSWGGLLVAQLSLVIPLLLVPCVLLGAIFPLATRLLQAGESGPATGRAYALNTMGTIAGSLLTGFLLLPKLGIQGVVSLAAAISALAGTAALLLPGVRRASPAGAFAAAGLALLGLAAAITAPRWDPMLMSLGTYRPFHARNLMRSFEDAGGTGEPTRQLAAAQRVLFYEEGLNASVLVSTDLEGRRRWMRVGGKIDAGTGDMTTQVMVGLLPAALADTGARTLIVGHGSGFTAAAALAAGIGATDIVELEQAVLDGARLFHDPGSDPLDDPRVTLHVEDARTRLMHGGGTYDLVISEPTNPWIAGVNNLFTEDFYARVRARLAPDGIFCQWIQLYELSPETFHSMLGAFLRVFPEASLHCVWGASDAILVAAPPGRRLARERLATPAIAAQLAKARLASVADVAAFFVAAGDSLRALARPAPRNTDDRPFVEYRAPRDLIEVGRAPAGEDRTALAGIPRRVVPAPGGPFSGWPAGDVWRARGRAFLAGADDATAARVFEQLRDAGGVPFAAELATEWSTRVRGERRAQLLAEARTKLAAGDAAGARAAVERLAAIPDPPAATWVQVGELLRQMGDVAASGAAAREALAAGVQGGDRLEALLLAGMSAQAAGSTPEALARFRDAQRHAPADPRAYDFEARILALARDVPGALAVVERGLRNAPGNPALLEAQRALAARR